jgi:fructose-bisphosphate aldolase class II
MALISMRQLLDHAAEHDYGVPAFNVDTDLRFASTAPVRRFLAANPAEFDPRKYLTETLEGMKQLVAVHYQALRTVGNASRIQPHSLEVMFENYATGSLDPVIQ